MIISETDQKESDDFCQACVLSNGLLTATVAARILKVSRQRMEALHGSVHFKAYVFWGTRFFSYKEVARYECYTSRKPGRPDSDSVRKRAARIHCDNATFEAGMKWLKEGV